jgi:hypothetical protein
MASILESLTDQLVITKYDDWLVFVERLNAAVASGRVRRIPAAKTLHIETEQWFLDSATGEIYAYVPPDSPILPAWERVDLLKLGQPNEEAYSREVGRNNQANLKAFTIGEISHAEAQAVKMALDILIGRGLVRTLEPNAVSEGVSERWFQDLATEVVYRLIELNHADEIRWEVVPRSLLGGKIH